MADQLEVLNVELRNTSGTRNARRLRRSGAVPAVVYGHGEDTLSLSVPVDEIEAAIRHGSRVVELRGGVNETAMITQLQWDTWGTHVLHLDFTRVSAQEVVEVEVAIELRGEAPGVSEGGSLDQVLHQISVQCRATNVPDRLELNINALQVGQTLTVADLDLPEGVKVLAEPEDAVLNCIQRVEVEEEEPAMAGEQEPEVIGGRPEEDES